jgi:hypothetical protein
MVEFKEISLPPPPNKPLVYYFRNDWDEEPEGYACEPPERIDYDSDLWMCEKVEESFARFGYTDTMIGVKQEGMLSLRIRGGCCFLF